MAEQSEELLQVPDEDKANTYKFLETCDNLIENIRIPRGKLRNMVRKQRKKVDPELLKTTQEFDQIFNEISQISYNFISEINQEDFKGYKSLYEKYNTRINELARLIPNLNKKIRKFGIF